MYTKTFAVATFAVAVSAQLPAIARRDFIVEARQTASLDGACQTAIASVMPIYSDIPIPPTDLQSVSLPSDPCETPALTGTLAAEYSSYTEEVLGWYTSHSDELLSALASCTDLASYASEVPVCSSAASGILSSASAIATEDSSASYAASATGSSAAASSSAAAATGSSGASASASATKSSASSSASASTVATAGAAQNGGIVAGIAGVVGVIAAVAAL